MKTKSILTLIASALFAFGAVTGVAAADMDSLSAIASCWRSVIFAAGVAATAPVVAMRVVVVVVVVVVVEF